MRASLAFLAVALLAGSGPARGSAATSCTACHGDAERVGDLQGARLVHDFENDVHATVGLSCHDCHGGNPSLDAADEAGAAMDPSFAENPYRGAPSRTEVPEFCGHCHSDPTYMKRFKPDARVDQVREYWTSQHGTLLREGDERVATCIDCHGTHGILRPSDPDARVYPTRVAETCRACHADQERMKNYRLANGEPLPIDQYARWRRSVHAAALLDREDLSAPTCNDCHGNHGAVPPGLDSVAFVCGQCHGREATLFRNSAKQEGFAEHNGFLSGAENCAECHSSEPVSSVSEIHQFTECETCHDNHAVIRPTVALLGPLPETPCAFCHESGAVSAGNGFEREQVQRRFEIVRDALLEQARAGGMAGDTLFDWLVERATMLAPHTEAGPEGKPKLRPHFERLWKKFRIGPTHFTYEDPVTGEHVRERVTRCTMCHGAESDLAGDPQGYPTSKAFLERTQELTVMIAQAERTLLAAQRGGIEVREAHGNLDAAVNSQIQLIALVHSFSAAEGSAFAKSHSEGIEQARQALDKARAALGEMEYRRRGLMVSLVIILLVLIGLGLKIRQLSRQRAEEAGS
jgi:hypothetical protein